MSGQIVGVRFRADEIETLERLAPNRGETSALVRTALVALLVAIEESAKVSAAEWDVPSFPLRRAIVQAIASRAPVESRLSRSRRWLAVVASEDGRAWRTLCGSRSFLDTHGFELSWTAAEKMNFGLRFELKGLRDAG